MGVSKNRGTPKWMVYDGGAPFFGNTHININMCFYIDILQVCKPGSVGHVIQRILPI